MFKLNHRILSALMALVLIFSLLSGITFKVDAALVDYQTGYVSEKYPNVIKNWGTREEIATFLSPNAEAFYSGTSYESLAALSGSSNLSLVNTSALYKALNSLMANAHTKVTSYDATREMYQYTDCQNNGKTSTKISAFYSGELVGPAWDSGATWNREHVWPNSKGGSGDNEDDIMMLRPETKSNNSSRGNAAFGESSGFYNPEIKFNNAYDVRGDIARIVLYTYVRWGTEEPAVLQYIWGSDGVIESKAILLKWMAEDPVDTWEMGRNDSVQSITGTRNVFVDYPELAFVLFDESIPQMTTPSGKAGSAEQETYTIEYFQNSVRKSTEQVQSGAKYTLKQFQGTVPEGYSFVGWATAPVENTTKKPTLYAAGTQAVAKGNTKYYAVLSSYDAEAEGKTEWTLVTDMSQISTGSEIVIAAKGFDYAMSTEQKNNNRGQAAVTKSGNKLTYDSSVAVLTLQAGTVSGSYAFYTGSGYLFAVNKTNNYLRTQSNLNDAASFYVKISSDGTCKITSASFVSDTSGVGNVPMQYNPDGMFACYPKSTQQDLALYVGDSGTGMTYYTTSWSGAVCSHINTGTTVVPATCTQSGTSTVSCNSCGEVIKTEVIPAIGHNYVNNTCTNCGDRREPVGSSATISFATDGQRVSQDSSSQVWSNQGATFTNNKAKSTSAVTNYYNPVRLYKNSELVFEFPAMTKIEVTCNTTAYATALTDSINDSNAAVTVSGKIVTIALTKAVDTFTVALSGGQVRVDELTIYGGSCDHAWSAWVPNPAPTCTQSGTNISTCTMCGETKSETVPAIGHSYGLWFCVVEPTCTEAGEDHRVCGNCGDTQSQAVNALGHSYKDGICGVCGAVDPDFEGAIVDTNLKFRQVGLSFAEYIGVQPMLLKSTVKDYDSYYVEAVQTRTDGTVTTILEPTVSNSSYSVYDLQMLPRAMTDGVALTIYAVKDGITYCSEPVNTSITALAIDKIKSYEASNDAGACRVLVDMLVYGTEVQKAFNYKTDDVPTNYLDEYASLGSQSAPTVEGAVATSGSGIRVYANSLSLGSKVEVQFMFKTSDVAGCTLVCTFGGESIEVPASEFDTTAISGYAVAAFAMKPRNFRGTMTIAVYDADGNAVSAIYTASIEDYAAGNVTKYPTLIPAMMNYGDAVLARFPA